MFTVAVADFEGKPLSFASITKLYDGVVSLSRAFPVVIVPKRKEFPA